MSHTARCLSIALCLFTGSALAESQPKAGAVASAEARSDKATPKKPDQRCEANTGSRIASKPSSDGRCDRSPYPTRTYSEEDLKSTGQSDIGAALKTLDPSIRR